MSRMLMMQTGRATKNQIPQPGGGDMFCRAMRFCGEAMGEAAPPMLEAWAMPRRRARDMGVSEGRLRRMGWGRGVVSGVLAYLGGCEAYLYDAEAKNRRCDVGDPH